MTAAEILELGEKYMRELDYENALLQFLKAIEIEPMNPRGYISAAESYIKLGRTDAAITILNQGLVIIPGNVEILSMLADLQPPEPTPTPTPKPTATPRPAPTPSPMPMPTPYDSDEVPNVTPQATIEIPNSNGTQFTLNNIYDRIYAGKGLDYDLIFVYASDATLTCNRDISLYEATMDDGGKFYHYFTYTDSIPDFYVLLETYVAGTPISLASLQTELLVGNPFYEQGKVTFVVQAESHDYGRQVYFYPSEELMGLENSEYVDKYTIYDFIA